MRSLPAAQHAGFPGDAGHAPAGQNQSVPHATTLNGGRLCY
jgi:hypothetical protein